MAFKMKGFSPFTKKTGNPSLEQGLGTDEDMIEKKTKAEEAPDVKETPVFETPAIEPPKDEVETPKDEEEDDDLPFKMSVSFSGPFNKGIAKDKSMEEDLKESNKSKEKKMFTREEIDDLYNQMNPNNPDRD